MCDSLFKNKIFSYVYPTVLFILSSLITFFNFEVYGAVFFVMIISAVLIMSSRLTDAMLPAMMLAVFVTRCYNSANTFLALVWAAVPPVVAVIFHFVKYRKPIKIGRSFYGVLAVAVSVTLGGLGTITASDYFAPTALFYVFGLGFGMVIFYLLVKSQLTDDIYPEIAKIMYITGLVACFCVINFYIHGWENYISTGQFIFFYSSNNLATFLMLAMPFPLYYGTRRHLDVLATCLMYVCTVFTDSRGGMIMGSIEFAFLLLFWALGRHKTRVKITISVIIVAICAVIFVLSLPDIAGLRGVEVPEPANGKLYSIGEYFNIVWSIFYDSDRARLLDRMFDDFKINPLFGVGIGYTGNQDIYNPVKGAMNWYHMWIAQVVGGLGILGILAYGYQLIDRLIIYIKNRGRFNFICLISYFGLFLMSQVNPGEFCPMPYAALIVTYFILLENKNPETASVPLPFKKHKATE